MDLAQEPGRALSRSIAPGEAAQFSSLSADCIMVGAAERSRDDVSRPARRSAMTDRRDEEREGRLREEDEKRQDDKEKRSEELREAWRRRHPDEEELERRRRENGGRA